MKKVINTQNDWIVVHNTIYRNNPLLAEVLCVVRVPPEQEREFSNHLLKTSLYSFKLFSYGNYFTARHYDFNNYPPLTVNGFIAKYPNKIYRF